MPICPATPYDCLYSALHSTIRCPDKLIERLWGSLTDADIPLTSAQQGELERRLATFEDERAQEVT